MQEKVHHVGIRVRERVKGRWASTFGARRGDFFLGYLFVSPLVFLVLALIAYPLLYAVYISMTQKYVGYPARFIGLANYLYLLKDPIFHKVVQNSLVFTVGSVAAKIVLGMLMALALQKVVRGKNVLRGLLLLPWVVPTVITALTWHWMFDGFRGLINLSLLRLGVISHYIPWLGQPATAMAAVMIANIWRGFPFFGVSFLAGMHAIPKDLYEAAEVDGASELQKFLRITIPGLKGVIVVTTLISTIFTLNDFNIVYVMTRGGPGTATHVFATYTYEMGFQALRWGRAVAISLSLLPLVAFLIVFLSRYLLREE
ncbi:MAG: sugar ABC transporter permease [candidate division NC10 bacterium]|nr:sugar ABC transporter permease [candidate division NC10 bacterium]